MGTSPVALSVVVVAHGMERELPRTLTSLTLPYQRAIEDAEYEVIVVDNGSSTPVTDAVPATLRSSVRIHRIDAASPSPAHAANVGVELATGALVGLIIDGARLASPGLLALARHAAELDPRAVVTAPAWHLGTDAETGDQAAEDALLESVRWEHDGYDLFSISRPAPSSARGLFGPMGESSSLFMARPLWDELGGLDEAFSLPGGGLVNHDLYERALGLPGANLIVLLGEGTFHQSHGGAATSGRISRDEMRADFEAIRGWPHRPPPARPTFLGAAPRQYLPYLEQSIALARARDQR